MEAAPQLSHLYLLLPLLAVVFIIAAGVILLNLHFHKNLYQQKLAQEELLTRHQQELIRSSIQAQEDERKRIASDIHDELGAALAIAKMYLITIEEKYKGQNDENLDTILKIKDLIETTIVSVRRISHELIPQSIQMFGLEESLHNLVLLINEGQGITLSLCYTTVKVELRWALTLGVYRIFLELINNTLKHANAKTVRCDISVAYDGVNLQYVDDGIGIKHEKMSKGIGHKNIEARVISLGGTFEFGNNAGGGFFARVQLPID